MQSRPTNADTPSVQFDLRQPHHADHVVNTAIDGLGGLDGVVNAAGVVAFGPFEELDDASLDELVAADFVGPLRVIRTALPHLNDGFVVNITGVVADQPMAGLAAYSAVKAGLSSATQALGRELRRRGIQVLDARPPHTETGLAGRPISGTAPSMPVGLDPAHVDPNAGVELQRPSAGGRLRRVVHHDAIGEVVVVAIDLDVELLHGPCRRLLVNADDRHRRQLHPFRRRLNRRSRS